MQFLMKMTGSMFVPQLIACTILFLSWSNRMRMVMTFTAPVAIRHHRHRSSEESAVPPFTAAPQSPLEATSSSRTTARSVVMRRTNGVNTVVANNGKATAAVNGVNGAITAKKTKVEKLPFIIEQLPTKKGAEFNRFDDVLFEEISQMCIDVFFNDNLISESKPAPIWKELQLAYLRNLQQSDLKNRRKRNPDTNMMFIAREVVPVSGSSKAKSSSSSISKYNAQTRPLLLDLSKVYNLPKSKTRKHANDGDDDVEYVCGRILGFVEVTQRPYGLGDEKIGFDEESKIQLRRSGFYQNRPILTNLSVRYEARGSGVGSRLLATLEKSVRTQWKADGMANEIILEVEDDNENALHFYQKRGYQPIFEDPASRRYDTDGLLLRQLRCNRIIMRKNLNKSPSSPLGLLSGNDDNGEQAFLAKAWQGLKESVLSF